MGLRYLLIVVLGMAGPCYSGFTQEAGVRFESSNDDAFFSVKSRFTGTAVVTSNSIRVRIESGVLTSASRGKEEIEEYFIALTTFGTRGSMTLSYSQPVPVRQAVKFGEEIVLPATDVIVPLENVSSRTNHWLVFGLSHATDRNPEGGYSFSETQRDLFTNLPLTTFRKPNWYEVRPPSSTTRYLQRHWTNFPVVKFLPPTNGNETVFQPVQITRHMIGPFKGRFYSGVRFTVPEWMDGDFEFALVHLYRSKDELRRRPGYSWGVAVEQGEFYGFKDVDRVQFKDLPETVARYPFTEKAYTCAIKQQYFVPGRTYLLWQFHYGNEVVVPDLALGMTIMSPRGRREFGEITWR